MVPGAEEAMAAKCSSPATIRGSFHALPDEGGRFPIRKVSAWHHNGGLTDSGRAILGWWGLVRRGFPFRSSAVHKKKICIVLVAKNSAPWSSCHLISGASGWSAWLVCVRDEAEPKTTMADFGPCLGGSTGPSWFGHAPAMS